MNNTDRRVRIGKAIASARMRKGLSQRQLSELTGYNHSNIAKIETGRYNVSIDILSAICAALGVEVQIVDAE